MSIASMCNTHCDLALSVACHSCRCTVALLLSSTLHRQMLFHVILHEASQQQDSLFAYMQGKKLMLITNSDYHYTNRMMSFAYNQFMPRGSTWRDLFNMVCNLISLGHQCRALLLRIYLLVIYAGTVHESQHKMKAWLAAHAHNCWQLTWFVSNCSLFCGCTLEKQTIPRSKSHIWLLWPPAVSVFCR